MMRVRTTMVLSLLVLTGIGLGCHGRGGGSASGTKAAANAAGEKGASAPKTAGSSATAGAAKTPAAATRTATPTPPPLGPPKKTADELVPGNGDLYAVFHTSLGVIVCRLLPKAAPVTVASFVGLATGQVRYRDPRTDQITTGHYFDGTTFHRVIPRFMIQGGDPSGTGRGGPGYRFADEHSKLSFGKPGVLAMANSGPNTNGSQFFITTSARHYLDGHYTIFGRLVSGMRVVKKIGHVKTGPGNRPLTPVVLKHLDIVRSTRPPKG